VGELTSETHLVNTVCEMKKFPALEEEAAVVALARAERMVRLINVLIKWF